MIQFDNKKLLDIQDEYKNDYILYCSTVSTEDMCLSLEQASIVVYILRYGNVVNRLDTGSGLSSYVMQKETVAPNIHVSVEDNDKWIKKTEQFLLQHKLSTKNLILWKNFRTISYNYDFIYHDLGNMSTRQSSLATILSKLNTGGYIMLDDVHKQGYRKNIAHLAKDLKQIDIADISRDKFGRYAYLYQKI
jgi:hypothetical protein